jgi:ubiquitin-like 1-activating enzyme E1 B
VEAGTTGYLGQVNVIEKESNVACYECKTQETQKVYPICTIRSTPSMPVHTIVWAKECYKLLFADKPEESMLFEGADTTTSVDNSSNSNGGGDDNNENDGEPSTFMAAVLAYRQALADGDKNQTVTTDMIQNILQALYVDEIQKQLNMGRYKTALKTPHVLDVQLIQEGCTNPEKYAPTLQSTYRTTDVWSPLACISEWTNILQTAAGNNNSNILPEFDKDDTLSMRFVTAASNLRSHVFGIDPLQSYYSAKGIAGNIIPASK